MNIATKSRSLFSSFPWQPVWLMVVAVISRQPQRSASRKWSRTMPEPASPSESTKQSGGISVTESRLSHSSLRSLSWLLGLFTASTPDPQAFPKTGHVLSQRVSELVMTTERFLVGGFVPWTERYQFPFGSKTSPRIVCNMAEYKLILIHYPLPERSKLVSENSLATPSGWFQQFDPHWKISTGIRRISVKSCADLFTIPRRRSLIP